MAHVYTSYYTPFVFLIQSVYSLSDQVLIEF